MIIAEEKNKKVIQSHDFKEVNCTIDAEDMRYVASLLRNNYSNTRLAVVREISANALDANAEANSSRPIEIKLPSNMNLTFSVRDFGGGLSEEDVFGLYSKYGKSTKRTSNNYIGAFGIGKFAPLSYGENFTCVSYHGGKKTSYNIFVDENDDTKIVQLHEEPSSEPNGLCVEVAVSDSDVDDFKTITKNFFKFFGEEEMPKFIGVEDDFIKKEEIILESKDGDWFILETDRHDYYSRNNPKVLMGRVSYPLDYQSINTESFISDDKKRSIVDNILQTDGFYLRVPLGEVKLHHSREALEYNKATQKKIISRILIAVEEIQEIAKEKLADSDDLWDAKRNYAKIINAMPYHIKHLFENTFEWNGMPIGSSDFHRDYQLQDDLIITHSWKEKDSDSRNGFKIRSQKEVRAICQDNYLFVIQDLESSHGNNLRVRTLMNEDENLQGVYIIHAKTNSAQNHIDHEWQIGKVDKKHIKYTSNIEKEKPQRSGVRKKNGSRANIPLFQFNLNGHSYRNADHWVNASDAITSIDNADDFDCSWKNKLVFVPIKNYKIDLNDDRDWDLGAMRNRLNRIRSRRESEENFNIFGVRAGDVKKLDNDLWINFKDFYKEYSQEVLLDNLSEAKDEFFKMTYRNSYTDDQESKLNEYSARIGTIFGIVDFQNENVAEDIKNAQKVLKSTSSDSSPLRELIVFLREVNKGWCELHLTKDSEDVFEVLKKVSEKYPMLVQLGEYYSSWREGCPRLKNDILDYISLVNSNGGES